MLILLKALACLKTVPPSEEQKTVSPPYQEELQRIESYINAHGANWGEDFAFQGIVQIYHKDSLLYSKTSGFADRSTRHPISEESNFRIASVSKTMTAVAILSLVESGQLHLSDTVNELLPDYPNTGANITIDHLLSHRSGIPNYAERPDINELMTQDWSIETVPQLFQNEELLFPPGSQHKYSNSGYFLLGLIIEQVSGLSYGEFLQQQIFEPAKLTNTRHGDGQDIENLVLGYTRTPDEQLQPAGEMDFDLVFGAGSIRSTCPDLHRYNQALHSEQLLAAEQLATMWTVHSKPPEENATSGYGYGWGIDQKEDRIIGHSGGINGFGARIAHLESAELFVCVLTNVDSFEAGAFAWNITSLIQGQDIQPYVEEEIVPLSLDTQQQFVGSWRLTEEGKERLIAKEVPQGYIDMLETVDILLIDNKLQFHGVGMQIGLHSASPERLFSKTQGIRITAIEVIEGDFSKIRLTAMSGYIDVTYGRQE